MSEYTLPNEKENTEDLPAIEVDHVTKGFRIYLDKGHTLKEMSLFRKRREYEHRTVLNDISFTVKKGETLALIGHNGCGKSTTLKMLTRIMYPDEGTITMRGRVSSLIELGAGFHPDMSGRENIYINASIFGLSRKEIDSRVDEIIEFSELHDYIDNPVRTYSSGMYMRLAFAVAINVNADILLVDEILGVGDANFQAKCYQHMQRLKQSGITIVIVTHALETVRDFCDRAIWINDGKITAEGKSSEVVDEYLAYMNAARAAAEPGKVAEPVDVAHYGSGEVKIISAQFQDSAGNSLKSVNAEEPFRLSLKLNVEKPIPEMDVHCGIYTMDGDCIFSTSSNKNDLHIVPAACGEMEVLIESEALHLFTGTYLLRIGLYDRNRQPVDYYRQYREFNVGSPYSGKGKIHYHTKWSINGSGTASER